MYNKEYNVFFLKISKFVLIYILNMLYCFQDCFKGFWDEYKKIYKKVSKFEILFLVKVIK